MVQKLRHKKSEIDGSSFLLLLTLILGENFYKSQTKVEISNAVNNAIPKRIEKKQTHKHVFHRRVNEHRFFGEFFWVAIWMNVSTR